MVQADDQLFIDLYGNHAWRQARSAGGYDSPLVQISRMRSSGELADEIRRALVTREERLRAALAELSKEDR